MLQTIIAILLIGVFIYAMFHNPGGGGHNEKDHGKRDERH